MGSIGGIDSGPLAGLVGARKGDQGLAVAPEPEGPVPLSLAAALDDPDWGIVQSPFTRDPARTVRFRHGLTIDGGTLRYSGTTLLSIDGSSFDHTDANEPRRS